jgi:hypothetical protein
VCVVGVRDDEIGEMTVTDEAESAPVEPDVDVIINRMLLSNTDRRRNLRRRGRNLIDCQGAKRIYRTLENICV